MESVFSLLVIHVSESLQVFCVFCACAVTHTQSFFDLLHLDFLLVSFGSLWIDFHHILLKFFFFSLAILLLEFVEKFRFNFGHSSILNFLSEK